MPLYDVEVIHRIVYKRRVRAENEEEAREKGKALWRDMQKQYIVDEFPEEPTVTPVAKEKDGDYSPGFNRESSH